MNTTILCCIIISILCSCTLTAQWTHIGLESRIIKDIAVGNNALFAVTVDSGSVYRSTDGGITWLQIVENGVSLIAISQLGTVFIFKSCYFSPTWSADSLYRSTDGGLSWLGALGPGGSAVLSTIEISPRGTIYCGRTSTWFGGMQWGWFTVSTDDGLSWYGQEPGPDGEHIASHQIAFYDHNIVTAGTFGCGAGCGGGQRLSLSTDDGQTWIEKNGQGSIALAWTKSGIYSGQSGATLLLSTDTANTWMLLSTISTTSLLSLPSGGILAGTDGEGIYMFSDNGDSIGDYNDGLTNRNVHTLAMDSLGYVYAGTDSGVFKISATSIPTALAKVHHLSAGWNLLSLPLHPFNHSRESNYPSACSSAFEYNGTYNACQSLAIGKGYWLKLDVDTDFQLLGMSTSLESVQVSTGWNIIGSLSSPFLASSIVSDPPGIRTGQFLEYDGTQYVTSDTIKPGKGYWVRVTQNGKLFLSTSPIASDVSKRITIIANGEMPPSPPNPDIVKPKSQIPSQFALEQNYPNPFNPSTVIRYQLPVNSWVVLKLYNVLGQEVATLVNEKREAGSYEVSFDGSKLTSGVYFYKLVAQSSEDSRTVFNDVQKMILIK
jgi:hypothetical protein